jgi:hypothetical protein
MHELAGAASSPSLERMAGEPRCVPSFPPPVYAPRESPTSSRAGISTVLYLNFCFVSACVSDKHQFVLSVIRIAERWLSFLDGVSDS